MPRMESFRSLPAASTMVMAYCFLGNLRELDPRIFIWAVKP